MQDLGYKEKEAAIFSGIISLIKRGINPYSIKVSDIALEANVGKGTIYDYFSSKEEAISKAILSYIGLQLQAAHERVARQSSFQAKYYELLDILVQQSKENKLYCKLLSPLGEVQELYEHLAGYQEYFQFNKDWIMKTYNDIFQAGEAEQVIEQEAPADPLYREMAMSGALAAFLQHLYLPQGSMEIEAAKASSYRILLKTLN